MTIEVEKRGLLNESSYAQLVERVIRAGAEDLGENDTSSVFYLIKGGQLKIQSQFSKGTAKIVWKSGDFDGKSSREEIEVQIDPLEYEKATALIKAVVGGDVKVIPTKQLRHDYLLDGVSISVKYSDHWGYHVEFEQIVTEEAKVLQAIEKIDLLAKRLGVSLMDEKEEKVFIDNLLKKL